MGEDIQTHSFEASTFNRLILKDHFRLNEETVYTEKGCLYLWKRKIGKTLISTPYRDRAAFHSEKHSLKSLKANDIPEAIRQCMVVKDVDLEFSKNTENISNLYTNSNVKLDDKIDSRLKYSATKNIKRAKSKYGLTCSTNNKEYFDSFYKLHLKNRKRIGVLPYNKNFFQKIFDDIQNGARNSLIFTCLYKNVPSGHLICLKSKKELISGHLCYDYSLRNYRITDFLFHSAFSWGYENGFNKYRFGADFKKQKSLIDFKMKLGAQPREQYDYYGNQVKRSNLNSLKIINLILRKSPVFLSKFYSQITKNYYFS